VTTSRHQPRRRAAERGHSVRPGERGMAEQVSRPAVVEVRILGPVEVARDGAVVRLSGVKPPRLLAVLAAHRGEVVSTDRLVDALWPVDVPASAASVLRTYVATLRRALGDDAVHTHATGYELRRGATTLDAEMFEQIVASARPLVHDAPD